MKLSPLFAGLAVVMTAGVAPAHADDDRDLSAARMQRLDDDAAKRNLAIRHDKAIEIARQNGLVTLREIELERDDEWKLEGRDAAGRQIEIELSALDGVIHSLERD